MVIQQKYLLLYWTHKICQAIWLPFIWCSINNFKWLSRYIRRSVENLIDYYLLQLCQVYTDVSFRFSVFYVLLRFKYWRQKNLCVTQMQYIYISRRIDLLQYNFIMDFPPAIIHWSARLKTKNRWPN